MFDNVFFKDNSYFKVTYFMCFLCEESWTESLDITTFPPASVARHEGECEAK